MMDVSLLEVSRLVAAANAARWREPGGFDAERQLDALFGTSQ